MRYLLIFFITVSNLWASTWEVVDTSSICPNFKLEKRKDGEAVYFRYFSKINNSEVTINVSEYDLQFLYTKLHAEIEKYCDVGSDSLNKIQSCVINNTFLLSTNELLDYSFQTCDESNKFFNQIKLKLYKLFGSSELTLFKEAKRICNKSNEEILSYYNSNIVNEFCISDFQYKPDSKVLDALNKLLAGKIKVRKFYAFKKLYQQDVLLNTFINKYLILYNKKPSYDLQERFISFILKKIGNHNKKNKFDLIFENYANHYIDLFLHESLSDNPDYRHCMSSKYDLPLLSSPDFQIIAGLDKLCGDVCRNSCSGLDILSEIDKCLKLDIFKDEVSTVIENLNRLNIIFDKEELIEGFNHCVVQTNNAKFCSLAIYKNALANSIFNEQKLLLAKYADFQLENLVDLEKKVESCLLRNATIDLEHLVKCIKKSKNAAIDKYYRKELSLANSTIVREYQFCSDRGDYFDECFEKLIKNAIENYLSKNEFDRSYNELNEFYKKQIVNEPIGVLKTFVNFFKIIQPDYDKNDNASYCRRNMKFVDTIMFHHTATPNSYTVSSINRDHMDRGGINDPWLMIGYHYLIQNLDNDNNHHAINIFQGRKIDIVGAHAGSNAYSENYPSELLSQLKSEKLSCGRSPIFKSTDAVIRGNEVKANTNSIGIAFIGNFAQRTISNPGGYPGPGKHYPADASLKKAADLSCMLQKMYPNIKKIGYHRMYNTETECPGWVTEKINIIKAYAKELGCEF